MSDNTNPTSPVLDELLKNVLITSREDPWGFSFRRCLGNNLEGVPCGQRRAPPLAEIARTLVTCFSGLPECGRDACFYDKVSRFLEIAYCVDHNPLVMERFNNWRIARGDLEEGTRSKGDENDVVVVSDPADESIITTRSSTSSLNSCFDTDPSLVSPCDTQLTTPDVDNLINQVGTLQIETSKGSEELTTIKPPATDDVQSEPIGPPKIALAQPDCMKEPPEETSTLSSEQISHAEIRRMRAELLEREQDAEKVEWCLGYYFKSPEKSKLLHKMLLNFSNEDAVPASVLVIKECFGSEQAFIVRTKAQLSGGKGFDDSNIVYQSSESFIGASRVVELVNETFARHPKDIAVDDATKHKGLMLPERVVIQAVRVWTDFVKLPAFVNGSLSQQGTYVADMAVRISPDEVVQWLDKIEQGVSQMKEEKGEGRGPRFVVKLSPQSAQALQELQEGMSMASHGFQKLGKSALGLVSPKWPRRLSRGKNADTSSLAVEGKGGSDPSPSETSTPTQRPLTLQTQPKTSEGVFTRAKRKSIDLFKIHQESTDSVSSPKRSGETVEEKEDYGDIYLTAIRVGVLLMCNVTELKEMGAWKEPEDVDGGRTVMDRFFAALEKISPKADVIA